MLAKQRDGSQGISGSGVEKALHMGNGHAKNPFGSFFGIFGQTHTCAWHVSHVARSILEPHRRPCGIQLP